MLYSMTGFGSAEADAGRYHIKVEIKTLNSKFLDYNLKLPRELNEREIEVKALIGQYLKRGKVNVTIELQPLNPDSPTVSINDTLFRSYYLQYEKLARDVNADTKDLFRLALHSPDVIAADEQGDKVDWAAVKNTLEEALEKCNNHRQEEGKMLQEELERYINGIRTGLTEVTEWDPQRIKQIRERISSNIDEIKDRVQVDQNRFEQELIYYIEKLDITEEKVRLGRHLDYFMEIINQDESQGKKLGFISQEIGREINTIGAKANDAVIQRAVVQMKDELEKIKEQTLNIL